MPYQLWDENLLLTGCEQLTGHKRNNINHLDVLQFYLAAMKGINKSIIVGDQADKVVVFAREFREFDSSHY